MTTRASALSLVIGLLVAFGTQIAPAAATAKAQTITLTASPTRLQVGQRVTLGGTTTPAANQRTVQLQQRTVGTSTWHTVKKVTTTSSGTFKTTLAMSTTADRYFRAYLPARPGYRPAHSPSTSKIVVDAKAFTVTARPFAAATVGLASTISGTATPVVDASRLVHVQRRNVGTTSWTTVRKLAVSSVGEYVYAFAPGSDQDFEVRVHKPGYGGRAAGYSRVVRVPVSPSRVDPGYPVPVRRQAVSLGIESVVNPQNWAEIRANLNSVRANFVHVCAGRVEWTAFDWAAHPEVAAEPGTDHIARVIKELGTMPDGSKRHVDLTIDALVPAWIKKDPSIAGREVDGTRATYLASATAIHDGPVGDRFVELARDLAVRYRPTQISFAELMFDDETFGADDFALYRRMTGARDWPRDARGRIAESSPKIGAWRSQVLYDLLARVRQVLDEVQPQVGHRVQLVADVEVNWADPSAGRPDAGQDYAALLGAVDRLGLWAYFGTAGQLPVRIERLTAAMAAEAPASRFTVSVGLWAAEDAEQPAISPDELSAAATAARSHGAISVHVTPLVLMTPAHWKALARVWAP